MDPKTCKCVLISDFNTANLAGYLENDADPPTVHVVPAPFGQVTQALIKNDLPCWQEQPDFAVVWTRPESVCESFGQLLNLKTNLTDKILEEVDAFCDLLSQMLDRVKFALVPTWVTPSYNRGLGMLDMKSGVGISNTLMRMNLRLSENLDKMPNTFLLDTQRWISAAGKNAFNPKLWYMGKIAFGNDVFIDATKDIKSALRGISGKARKLIVLDLDDTLWGGIVGDVGWQNIRLGGHDHIGEAYLDFQRALKSLKDRGVVLSIVSKNEEEIALEAIRNHPEMILGLDDFAGWKINWQDKAENIVDLVTDLNLGLQSAVFIDDSPIERGRVKEALPEVFVPDFPEDKLLYPSTLLNLRCFDAPAISREDLQRAEMYASEDRRKALKSRLGSLDEWLDSLRITVTVEGLNESNLQRAAQLFNKTNQMNLTTRRLIEPELLEWAKQRNHEVWTFRVSDRFGDSGLTGIISLAFENNIGEIVDFVLSCRVMGRKVEEAMLYTAIGYARSIGLNHVRAVYIPTDKNKPCLEFWKHSGFSFDETSQSFSWRLTEEYAPPPCIELIRAEP